MTPRHARTHTRTHLHSLIWQQQLRQPDFQAARPPGGRGSTQRGRNDLAADSISAAAAAERLSERAAWQMFNCGGGGGEGKQKSTRDVIFYLLRAISAGQFPAAFPLR